MTPGRSAGGPACPDPTRPAGRSGHAPAPGHGSRAARSAPNGPSEHAYRRACAVLPRTTSSGWNTYSVLFKQMMRDKSALRFAGGC